MKRIEGRKTDLIIIKADVGSGGGHSEPDEQQERVAWEYLGEHASGILDSYHVSHTGDDIAITAAYPTGRDWDAVQKLCYETLLEAGNVAEEKGLYAAKQDLLKASFCGNLAGMGLQVAKLSITEPVSKEGERLGQTFLGLYLDKTRAGALNLPFYHSYADPMFNSGLLSSEAMHLGFEYVILDAKDPAGKRSTIRIGVPEGWYDLLTLLQNDGRFIIDSVWTRVLNPEKKVVTGRKVAAISSTNLDKLAGRHIGKDDPVALALAQGDTPATGDFISPYALTHLVAGWMRGSHNGPLRPMRTNTAMSFRDGPPGVSILSFCVKEGILTKPVDMFDDDFWDDIRRRASKVAMYMQSIGPFGPGRLGWEDDEYSGVHTITQGLLPKFGEES